ncbi:S8 family serine peptidase [Engelhardtia mirabilis]|uniref:Subtilase family protein n=1 Tax=Engelhardtia mirabilis TaxID=2528011 RepID=A0A518BLT8_9BACT|nr:Subtilase family protein [Planctomycetes bacterium Pla133]QDV02243.1 Subtilase family protein [Planctomycetes bacterium Pla86]
MPSPFNFAASALTAALSSLAPAATAQVQLPIDSVPVADRSELAAGSAWILTLRHDAAAHRAALEDLSLWRRAGEPTGFGQRVQLLSEAQAQRSQPLRALAAEYDVELLQESWLNPSLSVWIEDPAELAALRAHPLVEGAFEASPRQPNQVEANAAHHIPAAHALQVDGGPPLVGTGVTVALLDSGMDLDTNGLGRPHKAFFEDGIETSQGPGIGGSRVLSTGEYGFLTCATKDGEDQTGHGTRMGAIMAGAKWTAILAAADGAAPDAFIRNYKVTDCGSPLASTLAMDAALSAAVGTSDVRVVNLSYDGTSAPTYFFNISMDNAELAGVLVVASAGNSGASTNFHHGRFGGLTVGASFVAQAEPYFFPGFQTSAIGPLPDGRRYPNMLATGEQISTAELDKEFGVIDSYGSSGAAALVSGSAALMFQARPSLDVLSAKALVLNTLAPVVAGDDDASGLGFLDTLAAVEGAIAGDVTDGTIAAGYEVRYSALAAAGQEFKATLTWSREVTSQFEVDDLDLELRHADGTVVASSTSVLDNVEQVTQTFPTATTVDVVVRMPASTSIPLVDFALATSEPVSSGPSFVVEDFTAAAPAIAQVAPQGVPNSGLYARFFVKGEGLDQVTAVDLGGQAATFAYQAPGRLRVDVPNGLAAGIQALTLSAPGGNDTANIVIGVKAPVLSGYVNFIDNVAWELQGQAGDLYGVFFSPSITPTDFPGVIQLDIGNAGASLLLVNSGALNVAGEASGFVGGGGGLPLGTVVYFQGVVFDFSTLSLIPSNVVESVRAVHFGW